MSVIVAEASVYNEPQADTLHLIDLRPDQIEEIKRLYAQVHFGTAGHGVIYYADVYRVDDADEALWTLIEEDTAAVANIPPQGEHGGHLEITPEGVFSVWGDSRSRGDLLPRIKRLGSTTVG